MPRLFPTTRSLHCACALLGLCALIFLAPSSAVLAQQGGAQLAPSHIAAARSVIEATGVARSFTGIPSDLALQLKKSLELTRPELLKDLDAVTAEHLPEFEKRRDEMMNFAAITIAKRLSEAELNEIDVFFKSATGRKYADAQPHFLNELVQGIEAWSIEVGTAMTIKFRDEMRKRGHDF